MCLFINNLSILKFVFNFKIEEIELPFDKQKNQRRSFCFILFETEESVNEVLKKPKHVLGGKEVCVHYSN